VKNRTRTAITIETERVLIVKKREGSVLTWCSTCAQQVPMVRVDEAATIARVSSRTVYRWVESDKVHFARNAGGIGPDLSQLTGW